MKFILAEGDWQKIARGAQLPESLRTALDNLGDNYRRFARITAERRRSSEVRADLEVVADHAARLLREIRKLDDAARMTLIDFRPGNSGPTMKRDALARLEHHTTELSGLEGWLRSAAAGVQSEPSGPTARADLVKWIVEGFAHAYQDCVGSPMTSEPPVTRLLADFVALVDPTITPRSLAAARRDVLSSLHN